MGFLVVQTVQNQPAMQETQVWSLGQEDPLKKGMATHSRTEDPGRLRSMGSQRARYNWVTYTHTHTYIYIELFYGFPRWCSGKEPTCQCRRHKTPGFNPWVGKIPWRRTWQPTPGFLPGESHGRRSPQGLQATGVTKSRMQLSNWVHTQTQLFYIHLCKYLGFPGGSDGKESACNVEDLGSIPGLRRSHGGGHDNPLQYSCLENPHGQRNYLSIYTYLFVYVYI